MAQEANLGPDTRASTSRRPRIVIRGVRVTEPNVYRRTARRLWLTFWGVAAALLRTGSLATAWCAHAVVILLLTFHFVVPSREKEPITVALNGTSDMGLTVPLMGPETERERVETEEAPDPVEEAETPVQDPTPEPAEPLPEPNPRGEVVEEPMRGESEAIDTRGETVGEPDLTSEAVTAYVEQAIGVGAQGSPPPALPRDAGRAIEDDPTEAVRALRAQDLGSLARGRPQAILVVTGQYDGVERILRALNIPHQTVSFAGFVNRDLSPCRVLIFNCADELEHGRLRPAGRPSRTVERLREEIEELETEVERAENPGDRRAIENELRGLRLQLREVEGQDEAENRGGRVLEKVRRFVGDGGYLVTTDYGLTLLEGAFPSCVRYQRVAREGRTRIEPFPSAETHELLRMSLLDGASTEARPRRGMAWQVDGGSYYFRYDPSRVQALIRGADLPGGCEAVAVCFRPAVEGSHRSGLVLHTLGHFQEQADRFGHFTLQNVLLNFLLEAFGP